MDTALWQEYELLQHLTDRPKIDARSWAIEEQTNEYLDGLASHRLADDAPTRSRITKNLGINRRRKHLRRQSLLHANHTVLYPSPPNPEAALIAGLTIGFLRRFMSQREWQILELIADGNDYRTIAENELGTVPGIKSLVSRCRSRLRRALKK